MPSAPAIAASENPTGLPVYLQISEMLIREIAVGRLADGARLPPEREMARELGASVGTLRKALAELEAKGMLERRQGSGNYVRANDAAQSLYSMFRLELIGGGGLPTARFLDVAEMAKPADLPGFGTSGRATRMRRLRLLNDTPIAVEEIWLDGAAGEVRPADLSESLYHYYQTRLGFWIARAEDRVAIGAVPGWAPGEFAPRPGAITGYIERLSWAQSPEPVEFSRTWFDTDKAIYLQRLR
ncbi:GntR family transcriptional regulator [Poseidonocella sedimentorum]|uniref:Transcriptional regulator, GntR family n=1 Tax=Poseidonocella sedimentorum TaxID=871652 RepID=A0A1I6D2W7_9RHOB|nr:GntR family transcriptional regulator [Poseidonocella sedimentorum]SFQ99657.1 transcriptional regulator, GntR family [Poseidonocella sedimentorum]